MQYNGKNQASFPPEKEVHKTTMYEAGSDSVFLLSAMRNSTSVSTAKQIP